MLRSFRWSILATATSNLTSTHCDHPMNPSFPTSGGFLPAARPQPQYITSPAPSHSSLSSTSSSLPHPRSHALRAGSAKENTARRYVEGRLLGVSRRFVKKFQDLSAEEMADGAVVVGYRKFSEVATDLSEIIDVLWLSGTPSLQIPYLLNIALAVQDYLPSFPASPKSTFALLRKLDHAFASLLKGEDNDTGDILPGFEGGVAGKGLSRTDMVRCRAIIEGTRVVVVELLARDDEIEEEEEATDEETDDDNDEHDEPNGRDEIHLDAEEEGENDMDIAGVYEKTITAIGKALSNKTGTTLEMGFEESF